MVFNLKVSYTLVDDKKTIQRIKRWDARRRDKARKYVAAEGLRVQADTIKKAPVGESTLKNSVHLRIESGGNVAAVTVHALHGPFAEFGTGRPGKKTRKYPVPSWYHYGTTHKMPPTHPSIEVWARRKGLNPWAVALGIKRRGGIKAKSFFYPAYLRGRKRLEKKLSKLWKSGGYS